MRRMGWAGKRLGRREFVIWLWSVGAFGCSGDESKSAPEVCKDYVSSYCAKAVSCAQETDRSDFSELCDFSFQVYLPCEEATHVWRDPQACLDQIASIRCANVAPGTFPPSPEACQGLLGNQ